MTTFLFTASQNKVFKKQFEICKEDLFVWNITNVLIPSFIILIPLMLFYFLPTDKRTFTSLLLNGSFSLLGINILFITSIFLINSKRLKDAKFEKDIISIRLRLIIYLSLLLMLGTIIYVLQIIFNIDSPERILTITLLLALIFYFSVGIGKRVFSIKDELIGISINDDIIENVRTLKASINDID